VTGPQERTIRTESVRIPKVRDTYNSCAKLSASIRDDGLRHPITLWADGTLISGGRRLFAHLLAEKPRIQAVFVGTIEEAAKRLLADNQDTFLASPMKWSEVCRLWEVLRRLDAPAAAKRMDDARRRGVELRRQTQEGKRRPGRSSNRSDDYVMSVICEPFGVSSATAKRIETMYRLGYGTAEAPDDKRELAREVLREVDQGAPIWPEYQRLMGQRVIVARPRPVVPVVSADAARQQAAWSRSLPQLEGLVAGLTELGPPNAELTWEQVGPVHARLKAARREIEKMINQMKGLNQS
jgi:hypothetical protein